MNENITGGEKTGDALLYDVVYDAPPDTQIGSYFTQDPPMEISEFEQYEQQLKSLTGKISFDKLGETSTNVDITLLSKETGLNYSYLEYFVLAIRIQRQFGFLPAFFYAVFRQGTLLKSNLNQWLSTKGTITLQSDIDGLVYDTVLLSQQTIQDDIDAAIRTNIIPTISKEMPDILNQCLSTRVLITLQSDIDGLMYDSVLLDTPRKHLQAGGNSWQQLRAMQRLHKLTADYNSTKNLKADSTFNVSISKASLPCYMQNNVLKVTVRRAALFMLTSGNSPVSVAINGGTAVPLAKDATRFGDSIQFIDSVSGFTGDLLNTTDAITFSLNIQNFASVKNQVTDAWLILNYTLG